MPNWSITIRISFETFDAIRSPPLVYDEPVRPSAGHTAPNLRPVAVLEQGTAALPGLIKPSGPVTLDGRPVEMGATASCPLSGLRHVSRC